MVNFVMGEMKGLRHIVPTGLDRIVEYWEKP